MLMEGKELTATKAKAKGAAKKLDERPVRFTAGVGILWVHPAHHKVHPVSGMPILEPGLRVVFTPDGNVASEPVGGYSRYFYPDDSEHRADDDLCDCAQCLADVREYIANRHNADIVARHYVQEEDPDADVLIPFAKWNQDDLSAKALPEIHAAVGFDLDNALRYEVKNRDRKDVVKALEALIASADQVDDTDVLDAEVELD